MIRRISSLNRRSPISNAVGGGFAIKVSASIPSAVCRPVAQTSKVAVPPDHGKVPARATPSGRGDTRGGFGFLDELLFHRIGFARQQRLIDEKVARGQKPPIRRHQITRAQFHHIARHQFGHEDCDLLPVADGAGAQRYLRLQGIHGVLGTHLLNEVHDHAEHYNRHGQ